MYFMEYAENTSERKNTLADYSNAAALHVLVQVVLCDDVLLYWYIFAVVIEIGLDKQMEITRHSAAKRMRAKPLR